MCSESSSTPETPVENARTEETLAPAAFKLSESEQVEQIILEKGKFGVGGKYTRFPQLSSEVLLIRCGNLYTTQSRRVQKKPKISLEFSCCYVFIFSYTGKARLRLSVFVRVSVAVAVVPDRRSQHFLVSSILMTWE